MARAYISYQSIVAFTTLSIAIVASSIWLAEVVQVKKATSIAPAFDLVAPLAVALGAQAVAFLGLAARQYFRTVVIDFFSLGCVLHAAMLHTMLLFSDWTSLKSRSSWYTAGRQSWLGNGVFQWVAAALSTIAFTSLAFCSIPFIKQQK